MQPALTLLAARNETPRRTPRVLVIAPHGCAPALSGAVMPERACRILARPHAWGAVAACLMPDLVILAELPLGQAAELLRLLRVHRATRRAPILVRPPAGSSAQDGGAGRAPLDRRPAIGSHSHAARQPILVVDDDRCADALADSLADLGWPTVRYAEAGAALAHIRGRDYAGLLIDLSLPGIGGLMLVQESLTLSPSTPVAVMSARSVPAPLLQQVLCRCPVIFLWKPLRAKDVHLALELSRGAPPGGEA